MGQKRQYEGVFDKTQKDLLDQNEKITRAKKNLTTKLNAIKTQKLNLNEDNVHLVQMRFDIENNKNKTLLSALT